MIAGVKIVVLSVVLNVSCHPNKTLPRNNSLPSQEETNNSGLYYDIVNLTLEYFDKEKNYFRSQSSDSITVMIASIAQVQTWNCHLYQRCNFTYHYSYVDTSYSSLSIGISKDYLTNVCSALKNPISLSKDPSKYNYSIQWDDYDKHELQRKRPLYIFAPVIKKDFGESQYEMWVATPGREGGIGRKVYFVWDGNAFKVNGFSYDPMDGVFCWSGEDYVSKLCED